MTKNDYYMYKQAGIGATATGGISGAGLGYLAGQNISNYFKFKPKSWQDRLARWGGSGLGLLAGGYLGSRLHSNDDYDPYKPSLWERVSPYAKGAFGLGLLGAVPYLGYKFVNSLKNAKNTPKDRYDGDMFKAQKHKWDDRVSETMARGNPAEIAAIKKNREDQFNLYDRYSNYTKGINKDLYWPTLMTIDHITSGDPYEPFTNTSDYFALEDAIDATEKVIERSKIHKQLYPKYYE